MYGCRNAVQYAERGELDLKFIKKYKFPIIAALAVIGILVGAFVLGGESPQKNSTESVKSQVDLYTGHETAKDEARHGNSEENDVQGEPLKEVEESTPKTEEKTITHNEDSRNESGIIDVSAENENVANYETPLFTDEYNTEPVPEEKPSPKEPENADITDTRLTCTLSVRCDNAVGKTSSKASVIPEDGVIFEEQEVVFYEGESVFNVLVREMKKNKIHLEFVNTPIYNSAYIEGINNLYEFDCGELSGWMYKVNDWFPNYGCSRYELKKGDKVQWVYTCDLGKDVGGDYSARNGMENE